VWVQGTLNGKWMKKSLGVRNWESAQKIVRDMESSRIELVTVADAFDKFLADCRARMLKEESVYKYELLRREMISRFGGKPISAISLSDLSDYRNSWKLGAQAARLRIDLIRRFFRFCLERGWCELNPAMLMMPPQADRRQVLPFSDEEMAKIMEALGRYPDHPPGRRKQVKAFVLTLRYTGLRIRDVVLLSREKVSGGELMMQTQKTAASVRLPLHDEVIKAIEHLPHDNSLFFWSGLGTPKSAVAAWERTLKTLFRLAGITGGHAHRFRHTMAVRLLMNGISLDNVAAILGNSPRIVEKYYSSWVPARQEKLEAAVRGTF
jgi:integrase